MIQNAPFVDARNLLQLTSWLADPLPCTKNSLHIGIIKFTSSGFWGFSTAKYHSYLCRLESQWVSTRYHSTMSNDFSLSSWHCYLQWIMQYGTAGVDLPFGTLSQLETANNLRRNIPKSYQESHHIMTLLRLVFNSSVYHHRKQHCIILWAALYNTINFFDQLIPKSHYNRS